MSWVAPASLISLISWLSLAGRAAADEPVRPPESATAQAGPDSPPALDDNGKPHVRVIRDPMVRVIRDPMVRVIHDPQVRVIRDPLIAAIREAEPGPIDDDNLIFDARPDRPVDRDTAVRLTGAELAARGAVDLATALAQLPEVTVRDTGRGGLNVDIRGARRGAVAILIDGVSVYDPYYGTFDVSTIPITDIVQIRVATTPASPIGGPGGSGGVIEVHTRDAMGPQLVIARLTGDSAPSLGATGTARVRLLPELALRLSASGSGGGRDLALPANASIGESRHTVTGAGRLEYRAGHRRIIADGFIDDRNYVAPPNEVVAGAGIVLVDRETSARATARLDDRWADLQVAGQVFTQYLDRSSRVFADPALTNQLRVENLKSLRSGAAALVSQPFLQRYRWALSGTVDFEKAVVANILNEAVRGSNTLVDLAGDVQYERPQVHILLAGGLVLPFGKEARAWPEGKAAVKFRPLNTLDITATAAYKGRYPSLRERFIAAVDPSVLGPERTAHYEVRASHHIADRLRVDVAPFFRRTNGNIRASLDPMQVNQLVNLGVVQFWGADLEVRGILHPQIEAGGAYSYARARASAVDNLPPNSAPVDRMPPHHGDVWILGRLNARLSGLARLSYASRSYEQTRRVAGHAVVSANLTARLNRQYLGVLRIDDLFDRRPEVRTGYPTAGRVVSVVIQGSWD